MHSSNFIFAISLLMLAPIITYAGTATQTDWSGGDGIYGPVIDWGNEYYADTDIECYIDPSNVILQKTMALIPLEHTVDGDFDGAFSVCAADVNGDGYMDVLGAGLFLNEITWWENIDGSGTSWTKHIVDGDFVGVHQVSSADVNGDGYMDVLGASANDDDITWWENVDGSGTSWVEHIVDGDFDVACSVYGADVNGDGYMDILGTAYTDNDITWWENMDGSGTSWTEHTVDGNFGGARFVYAADINADGYLDVLGAAMEADDITWWENIDGSGTSWTEYTVDGDFDCAYSVYSADVNGDGYMDVLGAAWIADDITWWENLDGSGTSWTEHTVDGDFDGAHSVYPADIDKDGCMDVLGAAMWADDITWWENVDGAGTSWTEHTVDGDFNSARSVYSTDVNGDGYMDVLGAALDADDITWWDLTEFLPGGSLESSVLDVQESPDWGTIDWTCTEPSGTSVALQVRASDNSSSMGAWSDTLSAPCTLEGILADEDNYFQYRAILNSANPDTTPILNDVMITWNPVSIEDTTDPIAFGIALLPITPNPASGSLSIGFTVPEMSPVELSVFDLTGRLAVVSAQDEYMAGYHQVQLEELAPGIYFCRMASGEFTATQRFVVIE